ncbi:MAG: LLM class F420-dependent oxidoreductase [Candidatus Nanopelagicales bacterium]|nr:LLM class F420-dependent oxidoreductase [Candidatus Nanopelagicales bacterium]
MELALHISDFTPLGPPAEIGAGLAATAKAADDAGFATLTMMDHYFQMESMAPASDPMLEGYTALGFLAGQTTNLQLGLLVTGATYRRPGLLAKIVSTLDVLSGGRAMLGIGAAWYEREHVGLDVPFPPMAERFGRLEETLQICKQMWSADNGPYRGEYYQLAETLCVPQPLQPGGPPILIGGMGEKKTLRLVAQYADACNLFDAGPEVIAHKIDVLNAHCADLDRDPNEVRKTVLTGVDPLADPGAFVDKVRVYADLGVTKLWIGSKQPDLPGWVSAVGDQVIPQARGI